MFNLVHGTVVFALFAGQLEPQPDPPSTDAATSRQAPCPCDDLARLRQGIALRYLLNSSDAAAEIELTSDQTLRVQGLTVEYAREMRAIRNLVFVNQPQRETQQQVAETASLRQRELRQRFEKHFDELLTDAQRTRIIQIDIQFAGLDAFRESAVRKALELNPDQEQAVLKLFQKMQAEAAGLYAKLQSEELSHDLFRVELNSFRSRGLEQVLALLSEEQRTRFQELKGPVVSFTAAELDLTLRVPIPRTTTGPETPSSEPEPHLSEP